ncbi:uncharacterized protein LOC9653940 isoform X2 [Selaginella moellendorffii]|uniref:uncharacterized protein LOC9653940 isoform X2 n=1 Tax=Selaginella moellendorffii TaxID=88036 RepID=UPI000D1C2EE3|nr:uncharacterized protein LOC9653940 isoform X2 [Selaginella moellendorffii]|eukprot:XP_002964550.2 uncharacterized protein LOC9653940 isoform X2 [Selaginella moellendorffii]
MNRCATTSLPPAVSDEEEDLRSNSSTASVVSSSSSLHLHHQAQLQQATPAPQMAALASSGRSIRRKKKRDDLCDACKAKSALWFCPADDAYLCHSCDQSVHSANAFSLRHERVSLQVEAVEPVKTNSSAASKKEEDACQEQEKDSWDSCGKNKRPRRNISFSSPICKNNRMIKPLDEETTSQRQVTGENESSSPSQSPEGSKNCNSREEGENRRREDQHEEELAHTVPVFVQPVEPDRSSEEDKEQHSHSPASGIATDLGDCDEESDDAGDIDRFLNADHVLSEDDDYSHPQERQEHKREGHDHGEQGRGLIVAPTAATCEDLNGLLGLGSNSLEELVDDDGDDDDEQRFDFAIRKNQAMRKQQRIPEFGNLGMDGSDGEGGFHRGRVKAEEHDPYIEGLGEEEFLKPCREGILGEILGLKLGESCYERDLQQMHAQHLQRRICLRLDYEDVLNAWSDRRPFLTDSSSAAMAAAAAGRINHQMPEDSTSDAALGCWCCSRLEQCGEPAKRTAVRGGTGRPSACGGAHGAPRRAKCGNTRRRSGGSSDWSNGSKHRKRRTRSTGVPLPRKASDSPLLQKDQI